MINIFGGNYDEIGSTNKNLILKTQGKIKIQWGKKFIDLIDNDGNINSKLQKLINKVNSLDDISKDGFYIYDGSLYVKYGDDILPLQNQDSDTFYVSFVTEQETTSEQKYTALKNLGLVYPTLSNVNNIPTNGIIYNEYDKSLYIIDNGVLSKYYLEIPNPYTKQFVIAKEGDGNGALVINGEGIENSLYFNDLQIYNQQAYAYYKSLKDHKFYVGNQSVVDITGSGIETNEIKSKGFSYDTGYAIQQEGSDYILYIDNIHVRKGIKAEAIKNIIPVRIYKEENVIIDSKVVETIPQTVTQLTPLTGYKLNLFFKYDNNYQVGDKLKIYVETPDKTNGEVNKVYPIDLEVIITHTGNTKLNYITVDYTISPNHPNNVLEYFNNTVCYLYFRIVKDNQGNILYELDENDQQVLDENNNPIPKRIINEDLVIGDLSGYIGSNNKTYGIISKNNKFYSAEFDKDGENNPNIFPIYSQELYDEFDKHYNDSLYNKVIPPLGVVKDLDIDYYVGVCTITYKNQRQKVVILPDTKFNFRRGTILTVVFTHNENNNTNTYDVTTNNPIQFNVYYNEHLDENDQTIYNNTGFKTVYYLNTIKLGQDPTVYGKDGESITYIYDGTNWNWLSGGGSDATLNPILNDINIQNNQLLPNELNNHKVYDNILMYKYYGDDSQHQPVYNYMWTRIDGNVRDSNNIPKRFDDKGVLIYDAYNRYFIPIVGGNNGNTYLKSNSSHNYSFVPIEGILDDIDVSSSGFLKRTITNGNNTYSWDTSAAGGSIPNPSSIFVTGAFYGWDGGQQKWISLNDVYDLVNVVTTLKKQTQLSNLDVSRSSGNTSIHSTNPIAYARDVRFDFYISSNATWKVKGYSDSSNGYYYPNSISPESGDGNVSITVEFNMNTGENEKLYKIIVKDFFNQEKFFNIVQKPPISFTLINSTIPSSVPRDGGSYTIRLNSSFQYSSFSGVFNVDSWSYTENGNGGELVVNISIPSRNDNNQGTTNNTNCYIYNIGGQRYDFEYTQLGS